MHSPDPDFGITSRPALAKGGCRVQVPPLRWDQTEGPPSGPPHLSQAPAEEGGARTHHALLRLDEGPAEAVHLAVEAAGVAQVVAGAVPPPQRRLDGAAVHALATLGQVLQQVCGESGDERRVRPRPTTVAPHRPPHPTPAPHGAGTDHTGPLPCPRPSPRTFLLNSQSPGGRRCPRGLLTIVPRPLGAPRKHLGK